jgi:uncharacterized protein YnzC (UPF0291/DUF896 family)
MSFHLYQAVANFVQKKEKREGFTAVELYLSNQMRQSWIPDSEI